MKKRKKKRNKFFKRKGETKRGPEKARGCVVDSFPARKIPMLIEIVKVDVQLANISAGKSRAGA